MVKISELTRFLRAAIRRYEVPGASFAVLRNDRIVRAAQAGVVNLESRVPVTPDAVFQIGSITKPLTATLVMQLVDEGRVALDDPLVSYLPDFRVARADVTSSVTIRELLSHTSGIEGDFFIDSGRGDEAIRRIVDRCAMVPSQFERGEMMSYCNLGFAALGRLLEVMHNRPFGQIMSERLFAPLGMQHAFASPEEAIRYNCAIGHVPLGGRRKGWQQAAEAYLSFGQAAAGSVPTMSATDLLQVARLHLNRGRMPDGAKLLNASSVRAMQRRQVKLPRHSPSGVTGWGLGWFLVEWSGEPVYGHDGGTIGQSAFLRVFPRQNLAFALLTNGGRTGLLFNEVCEEVIRGMVRAAPPTLPDPARVQPRLAPYVGHYENMISSVDIGERGGRLVVQRTETASGQKLYRRPVPLTFIDRQTARFDTGNAFLDANRLFFTRPDDERRPEFVQTGFRQLRRVGE